MPHVTKSSSANGPIPPHYLYPSTLDGLSLTGPREHRLDQELFSPLAVLLPNPSRIQVRTLQYVGQLCNVTKIISECTIAAIALAILVHPVAARTLVNCSTTKVIITSTATGDSSARTKENISFWIDDAAKALAFSDGRQLRVTRFDDSWISADREDIQYEFDRRDRTLTYAGATIEGGTTTTIVGSGQCETVPRTPE